MIVMGKFRVESQNVSLINLIIWYWIIIARVYSICIFYANNNTRMPTWVSMKLLIVDIKLSVYGNIFI